MSYAYAEVVQPQSLLESQSSLEETEPAATPRRWSAMRVGLVVSFGAALACVCLLGVRPSHASPGMFLADTAALTMLSEDPCKSYDFLKMTSIKVNKLDDPSAGLVFSGEDIRAQEGQDPVPVELHVTTQEAPIAWPAEIGFNGNFMGVNTLPGKEMHLDFKVTEIDSSTPKTLPKAYITFFDLDSHAQGNAEYVCVSHFLNAYVTKGSELTRTEEDKNGIKETCFTASTVGTGLDNPKDPLTLTPQQLNRAVTLEFKDFVGLTATVGSKEASGQTHGRKFDFIGRPSVLCAEGSNPDDVVTLEGTDDPTVSQCCLLQVSSIAIACAKAEEAAFWQRMCSFARRLDLGSALAVVGLLLFTTVAA